MQILLNRSGVNICWLGNLSSRQNDLKASLGLLLMVTNICMGCCLAEFGRPNKVQPLLNQTDGSHDLLLLVNL